MDKRNHPRQAVPALHAHIYKKLALDSPVIHTDDPQVVMIINISSSGAALKTPISYQESDLLEVVILHQQAPLFTTEALVRYSIKKDTDDYQTGVLFLDINQPALDHINDLFEQMLTTVP